MRLLHVAPLPGRGDDPSVRSATVGGYAGCADRGATLDRSVELDVLALPVSFQHPVAPDFVVVDGAPALLHPAYSVWPPDAGRIPVAAWGDGATA